MPTDDRPPLALLLLRASRWFDRRVIAGLEDRGWPRLSAAQTLAFAHLDRGGTPPSELARRLGTTRQSTSDLVAGLRRLGLVDVVPDPTRARGQLVRLTRDGARITKDAREILAGLEHGLPTSTVQALRTGLEELGLDDRSDADPSLAAQSRDRATSTR